MAKNNLWISFESSGETKSGITKIWTVITKDSNIVLGEIRWHSSWRRYCFLPRGDTLFEQDCLRNIADFIEAKTIEHKFQRKKT